MRRLLGSLFVLPALPVLAALTVLGGCGEDPEDRAEDPATQVQTTPADPQADSPADPPADPQVVDIVSGTAADGDVARVATVIEDDQDLERYLRQFDSSPFVGDLTDAIDAHPLAVDRVLGLAVIAISCDEPPSATVTFDGQSYVVTPGKVVNPHPECFAPVTSVAVLDLPQA